MLEEQFPTPDLELREADEELDIGELLSISDFKGLQSGFEDLKQQLEEDFSELEDPAAAEQENLAGSVRLFRQVSKKRLTKLSGAVVLRHYRKEEMMCREGEPGFTAFYVITTRELLGLREFQIQESEDAESQLPKDLRVLPKEDKERRIIEIEAEREEKSWLAFYLRCLADMEALRAADEADEILGQARPELLKKPAAQRLAMVAEIERELALKEKITRYLRATMLPLTSDADDPSAQRLAAESAEAAVKKLQQLAPELLTLGPEAKQHEIIRTIREVKEKRLLERYLVASANRPRLKWSEAVLRREKAERAREDLRTRHAVVLTLPIEEKRSLANELDAERRDLAGVERLLRAMATRPAAAEVEALRYRSRQLDEADAAEVRLVEAIRTRYEMASEVDPEQLDQVRRWVKQLAEGAMLEKRRTLNEISQVDPSLKGDVDLAKQALSLRKRAQVSLVKRQHELSKRNRPGMIKRALTKLTGGGEPHRPKRRNYIPIDGPVDLSFEDPVNFICEGELFGELSCVSRTPRSATVRALEDCYILEMVRSVFDLLQRSKEFKARVRDIYMQRTLKIHLRNLPIFSRLDDEVLDKLCESVEIMQFKPGEHVFEQGDRPDNMYVIRTGMVKVLRRDGNVERVMKYLSRGDLLGEMGVVFNVKRFHGCQVYTHPTGRGGGAEMVMISRQVYEKLLKDIPVVRAYVEEVARERVDLSKRRSQNVPRDPSGQVEDLGLLLGQKLMMIDLDRCTRCNECVRACIASHDDGRSRIQLTGPQFSQLGQEFRHYLIPATCRQCLDPVCMIGCPVGSINKGDNGEIAIEDWCIGCGVCANNCPYNAIIMHDRRPGTVDIPVGGPEVDYKPLKAVVCDQCSSLNDGIPRCVYSCPHEAAIRVNALDYLIDPSRQKKPWPEPAR